MQGTVLGLSQSNKRKLLVDFTTAGAGRWTVFPTAVSIKTCELTEISQLGTLWTVFRSETQKNKGIYKIHHVSSYSQGNTPSKTDILKEKSV